jgi:hypothetical protein
MNRIGEEIAALPDAPFDDVLAFTDAPHGPPTGGDGRGRGHAERKEAKPPLALDSTGWIRETAWTARRGHGRYSGGNKELERDCRVTMDRRKSGSGPKIFAAIGPKRSVSRVVRTKIGDVP